MSKGEERKEKNDEAPPHTGSSLPRECITVIFMKTVTINSRGRELVTAGHERDMGFKYGKMKGLKISPPQSVARIDHTSFLCAGEMGEERRGERASSSRGILPPAYPPSVPCPTLPPAFPLPPPPSHLRHFVHLPFRASRSGSRNMPFFKQTHPPPHGVRACFLVGLRATLETWHLRDSRENSVKRLERRTTAWSRACLYVQTFPPRVARMTAFPRPAALLEN